MINSNYALNILDALFRTNGANGESAETEQENLQNDLGLKTFTYEGESRIGIPAEDYFAAFENNNYKNGSSAQASYDKKAVSVENGRWFDVKTYTKSFTYSKNGSSLTENSKGWYLVQRQAPVNRYPKNSFLALFTTLPNEAGKGGVEPDPTTTTYMRVNLHWSILTGEDCLSPAAADANNNNISTISNKEIIMFPEVAGNNWGDIKGFGVFEDEKGGEPILWGRLTNEGGQIEAVDQHVPLFRKGNFKVYLS